MYYICCFFFVGSGHDDVYVTYDGFVLAKMKRKDGVKAHCVQMAALYNFDANYKVSKEGKEIPGIRNYFDFVSVFFWKIRIKDISSGDGVTLKRKPVRDPVNDLINRINNKLKI